MITKLSIGDVSNVEATLTITMSIRAWREVNEELDGNEKLNSLNWHIIRLLDAMGKHWISTDDE